MNSHSRARNNLVSLFHPPVIFYHLCNLNHSCNLNMADIIFEIEPPIKNSRWASLDPIQYVRHQNSLRAFQEQAHCSLDPSVLPTFNPDPMPLPSHATVTEYSSFLMETRRKKTISVRFPLAPLVRTSEVSFTQFSVVKSELNNN